MKRYLYAQEQLKGQGKARVRTWPNNKSGCTAPPRAATVTRCLAALLHPSAPRVAARCPVLQEEVAKLKQQKSISFVDWCPTGYKVINKNHSSVQYKYFKGTDASNTINNITCIYWVTQKLPQYIMQITQPS